MVANSRSGREDVKAVVNNGMNGGEFLEDIQSRKTADDSCVFSESILWKIQRDFYETHGIQCWQQVCTELCVSCLRYVEDGA